MQPGIDGSTIPGEALELENPTPKRKHAGSKGKSKAVKVSKKPSSKPRPDQEVSDEDDVESDDYNDELLQGGTQVTTSEEPLPE